MPTSGDRFKKTAPRDKRKPAAPPAEVVKNLEMEGDKLKVYSLADLIKHKRPAPSGRKIMKLGDVLVPWFEKAVEKPSEKLAGCAELWLALVPKPLLSATRLVAFQRGTLTVATDNATVRAELDATLRRGLLRELQTSSKGTIYRVRTCIHGSGIPEVT